MQETVLDIAGIGIAPGSGRVLSQSLSPIRVTDPVRLWDGTLKDMSRPAFRKYATSISGADMWPPAFGGLWVGMTLTVYCAAELEQVAGTAFERPHVPGSVIWRDSDGNDLAPVVGSETTPPPGAAWVVYRPILTVMVKGWSIERDEWGEVCSWSLDLEEV